MANIILNNTSPNKLIIGSGEFDPTMSKLILLGKRMIRPYILGGYLTNSGGYYSLDQGETWIKFDYTGWVDPYYRTMEFGEPQANDVYVSRSGQYLCQITVSHASTCTRVRLHQSNDHGKTWTYQDFTNVGGFGMLQFIGDGQKQYLMGHWGTNTDGKGYSTDYGANFTLQNYTVQGTIGTFASLDGGRSYGGLVNGGVHLSLDQGASWTENWKAWGGSHQYGITDDSGKYIMSTRTSPSSGIAQYSTDSGVTDTQYGSTNQTWIHAMNRDASFCIFANGTLRKLVWSDDYMSSWTEVAFTTEMPSATYIRMRIHHGYDTVYLVSNNNSGDQKLYKFAKGDSVMTVVIDMSSYIGAGVYLDGLSINKFGGKDCIVRCMNGNLYRIDDVTNPSTPTLIWDGTIDADHAYQTSFHMIS